MCVLKNFKDVVEKSGFNDSVPSIVLKTILERIKKEYEFDAHKGRYAPIYIPENNFYNYVVIYQTTRGVPNYELRASGCYYYAIFNSSIDFGSFNRFLKEYEYRNTPEIYPFLYPKYYNFVDIDSKDLLLIFNKIESNTGYLKKKLYRRSSINKISNITREEIGELVSDIKNGTLVYNKKVDSFCIISKNEKYMFCIDPLRKVAYFLIKADKLCNFYRKNKDKKPDVKNILKVFKPSEKLLIQSGYGFVKEYVNDALKNSNIQNMFEQDLIKFAESRYSEGVKNVTQDYKTQYEKAINGLKNEGYEFVKPSLPEVGEIKCLKGCKFHNGYWIDDKYLIIVAETIGVRGSSQARWVIIGDLQSNREYRIYYYPYNEKFNRCYVIDDLMFTKLLQDLIKNLRKDMILKKENGRYVFDSESIYNICKNSVDSDYIWVCDILSKTGYPFDYIEVKLDEDLLKEVRGKNIDIEIYPSDESYIKEKIQKFLEICKKK